jgi:hypothetical protein
MNLGRHKDSRQTTANTEKRTIVTSIGNIRDSEKVGPHSCIRCRPLQVKSQSFLDILLSIAPSCVENESAQTADSYSSRVTRLNYCNFKAIQKITNGSKEKQSNNGDKEPHLRSIGKVEPFRRFRDQRSARRGRGRQGCAAERGLFPFGRFGSPRVDDFCIWNWKTETH